LPPCYTSKGKRQYLEALDELGVAKLALKEVCLEYSLPGVATARALGPLHGRAAIGVGERADCAGKAV
jgi:hypothetical protein